RARAGGSPAAGSARRCGAHRAGPVRAGPHWRRPFPSNCRSPPAHRPGCRRSRRSPAVWSLALASALGLRCSAARPAFAPAAPAILLGVRTGCLLLLGGRALVRFFAQRLGIAERGIEAELLHA